MRIEERFPYNLEEVKKFAAVDEIIVSEGERKLQYYISVTDSDGDVVMERTSAEKSSERAEWVVRQLERRNYVVRRFDIKGDPVN